MSRRKTIFSFVWMALVILFGMSMLFAAVSHAAGRTSHSGGPVVLKGYGGDSLLAGTTEPYSPALTCTDRNPDYATGCHSYTKVTNGYHFQQGRTNASGTIVVSDTFNPVKPWILSAGMFGKW